MDGNPKNYSLDPEAQEFVEATANPPYLYQIPIGEARKTVDEVQDSPIDKPEIDEEWFDIDGGQAGPLKIRIVRPRGATETLPVIVYVHGAGWVFGNAHTHDRLVRDLAVDAHAAVVFPEYDRSPEAGFPVAIEQSYAAARWVVAHGTEKNLDATRMAVSGDSVGGNMAIALTLLAKERGDVSFVHQLLFYPVVDDNFDTPSYREFAEGYWLRREAMGWFWDQYTTDPSERAQIIASPLNATIDQLSGLPPALIITAEADVLRDGGEAYATNLRRAGVRAANARFGGTVHDFVMVNALHESAAATAAMLLATATLKAALH